MSVSPPSVLAIIPARGGSKGLPRKNVLDLAGKPLIAWTIGAALQAKCISRVIVSTDDDEIAQAALAAGADVPFRRPAGLSSDTATSLDAVLHGLDSLPETYDYVVLLQPTSPLRTAAHIDAAFDLLRAHDAPSCVSVCEVSKSPYLMVQFGADARITPVLSLDGKRNRRQDLPPTYELNGAIYITTPAALRAARSFVTEATLGLIMPRALSTDIDTAADLHTVQTYLSEDHHAET
jgi:CMP-N,N'-diacetyllegionaminic acid synthase